MENKIRLLAVCGPTASGKTALSIALAKALGGEIVSCDSMQIYRGMEIGTAKPTPAEMDGVPHHLLGFLEPSAAFSAADYTQLAAEAVRGIVSRGRVPLLVGGTGLYARALLRGMSFSEESRDEAVRAALYDAYAADGIEPLYARLQALDPEAAAQIHPNNAKRVIRALEYCLTTGGLFSAQAKASQAADSPYDYKMLCLSCRDRETLYARINRRVDQMLEDGLLEEARLYFERCGTSAGTSAQAIGYKELLPYFEGRCTLPEAVENIKMETRRYAKRQLTWFRREENTEWLYTDDYPDSAALCEAALRIAAEHFAGGPGERKCAR